jgi:hypothetical protein
LSAEHVLKSLCPSVSWLKITEKRMDRFGINFIMEYITRTFAAAYKVWLKLDIR